MADLSDARIEITFPNDPVVVLCKRCQVVAKKRERDWENTLVICPACHRIADYKTFQANLAHLLMSEYPEIAQLFPNIPVQELSWHFTIKFER